MKERVQKFGRFLSGMVMPNIGAFIAWGLIAALFIEAGWFPNAVIAQMVTPMLSYLLPILIGYTGGKVVGGQKGAVAGALATLGAIASTNSTMFIGAMICGPLGGWCIKKFDEKMEGRIPAGFEMVVNNFSVGVIGGILAIVAIFAIGPACVFLTDILGRGVGSWWSTVCCPSPPSWWNPPRCSSSTTPSTTASSPPSAPSRWRPSGPPARSASPSCI